MFRGDYVSRKVSFAHEIGKKKGSGAETADPVSDRKVPGCTDLAVWAKERNIE